MFWNSGSKITEIVNCELKVANHWLVTQSLAGCFCKLHSPVHFVSLLRRSKLFPILSEEPFKQKHCHRFLCLEENYFYVTKKSNVLRTKLVDIKTSLIGHFAYLVFQRLRLVLLITHLTSRGGSLFREEQA